MSKLRAKVQQERARGHSVPSRAGCSKIDYRERGKIPINDQRQIAYFSTYQ